jgi:hypothetical protein
MYIKIATEYFPCSHSKLIDNAKKGFIINSEKVLTAQELTPKACN